MSKKEGLFWGFGLLTPWLLFVLLVIAAFTKSLGISIPEWVVVVYAIWLYATFPGFIGFVWWYGLRHPEKIPKMDSG